MPAPNLPSFTVITLFIAEKPVTCLPQPVFLPKRFKLYDVRMILQREHDLDEQRVVFPLSPSRHSLVVPCQRRFSFPGDRPAAANLPRLSTDTLLVILSKTRGAWMDGGVVAHRYASYFAMEVGCPMTLYTRRTVGQGVWCRHVALNWSATTHYQTSGQRTSYDSIPLLKVSCPLRTSSSTGALFPACEVHV